MSNGTAFPGSVVQASDASRHTTKQYQIKSWSRATSWAIEYTNLQTWKLAYATVSSSRPYTGSLSKRLPAFNQLAVTA